MSEESAHVLPASPVTKSSGVDRRRSLDISARLSSSSGKGIPPYLQASTGSCHEFCKHGKQEEHVHEVKESRPWRKYVTGNSCDVLHTKETGATAVIKKTVVVKPKPSADPKIQSPSGEIMEQEIKATSEHVHVHTEQASSDSTTTVSSESKAPDASEFTFSSEEKVKQVISVASENIIVTAEEASLDTKDLNSFKKSSSFSKLKPSLRSLSPISISPSAEKSIAERKSVEGNKSLDGRKAFERRKSFDGMKSVERRKSVDGSKHFGWSIHVDQETTKNDLNMTIAEDNSEGGKNADEMNNVKGSNSSLEKKGSEDNKSLNLETIKKDGSLGSAKKNTKSELLKKHVAAPKPKTLTTKPSPSLIPSIMKPPSPIHPSIGKGSRTSDDNQVVKKCSTSKLDVKKVRTSTPASPSSRSSVTGEESLNTKKVRVVRVVPSVRGQSRITKVEAKDPRDQGVKEDTADAIKIEPEKKPLASAKIKVASSTSLLPTAPSVSKSTISSRTSYLSPRIKKMPGESEPKEATKYASTSGLRKGKAVDLESKNHGPSKPIARKSMLPRETAQINRPSMRKRDITGRDVQKNSSDSFLLRRPTMGRKKNVQVLFNKVIEETASRLVRTRRSKVLALVGAFETVISIQKKSSARAKPKAKKISSSSKTSC
ncbi:unnamed protein product [Rhodiola kirilowii]